ncbi:IgGFc-binding protein-like [Anguilla anguilla]|uniref:IgGFc-binding protein-like n=1 Tax=Anguilla anguilla TaxID=7936 RepID=UPI0015B13AF9|nr:IgGFc-binding protein-like [Anguilla anguilla]XP_035236101.1 IgGFc-binding protein-like [Anguilla anguilla]
MFRYLLMLCASIHVGFAEDPCEVTHCDHNQTCVVQDGLPVCLSKPRLCSAWGESHYHTLDGRTFDFHGTCNYTFARAPCHVSSNASSPVEVQIAGPPTANATASFDRVLVGVQGFDITMIKGELRQVWVNGLKRLLPCYLSSTLRLFPSCSGVVLETGLGLSLRYDWLHHLEVRVSQELSSSVCGLCGGSGRDSTHGLPAPGGNATVADRAAAVVAFARSWKTGGNGSLCGDDCGSSCPRCEPARLAATPGVRACGLLQDPKGPFANCLKTVDPAPYVRACKDDLCTQKGDHALACRALKAFADACQGSGTRVSPWRELANCSMACAANSHYETCGSLCPATCGDPDAPSRCRSGCAETCQCDQGFLLCKEGCVRPSQCGCTHQGSYRPPNQTFWADKCQQRCSCSPASRNATCIPARCEHDEKCLVQDGAYGCHKGPRGLCLAQGDPHYTTFDGRRFDFHGNCVYLLASHCPSRGALPDFKIEVQNERRGTAESFSKMVRIRLLGYEIQISLEVEDKVLVNGLLLGLPTVLSRGKVKIYKTGLSLYVESDFGLMLRYNWNNLVTLAIPRSFAGAMCGICGNFNGDKNDDLVPPMSSDANSSVSLIRWKTSEIAGCTDMVGFKVARCPNDIRAVLSKGDRCGMIMDSKGPFRHCHETVDPLDPFENCISDVFLNKCSQAVLCQNLAGYVAACQDAGVEVYSWRSPKFCSMSCPANSEYALCSSPTPNSCAEPPSLHAAVCQEGCQCLPGFFRSGEECVPELECGCLRDGVYHASGATFFPGERCLTECVCEGRGQARCRNSTCPAGTRCGIQNGERACYPEPGSGRCSLSGGVHVRSFDGRGFDFRGTCGYVLAQTCGGSAAKGSEANGIAAKGSAANGTEANRTEAAFSVLFQPGRVHLQIYGTNLTLTSGRSGKVEVNGVLWNLPAQLGELRVLQLGLRVQVEADTGVILAYDRQDFVQVTVLRSYAGRLCGLCGDFDGNATNDLRLPGGALTSDPAALAASWKAPGLAANCSDGCGGGGCPACNGTEAARFRSEEHCGLLSAPAGPFRACLSVVDPGPQLENCVYDLCVSHGDRGKYCSNLQAYTLACHAAGARIEPWRNRTFCPLACPPNSEYSVRVDTCAVTCANVSHLACQSFRAEGCRCDPGFQLSVNRCVEAEACGCFQHGRYYELGETFWAGGCKKRCHCSTPGTLRCESAACPEGRGCGLLNGSMECLQKGAGSSVAYPGASCWVLGGSYFSTFDGTNFDFQGNCTYILARKCGKGASSPPFTVLIKKSQDLSSALKTILIDVSEDHIVMKPGSSSVWVNGQEAYLPATLGDVTIHRSSFFIFLDTTFGLSLKYNGAQYLQVSLRNFTDVCGLCGDYNGDAADDLRTPEGAVADAVAFGWSWRDDGKDRDAACVAECSDDCAMAEDDPPPGEDPEYEVAVRIMLWSEYSPFLRCHVSVDPSAYLKLCQVHHCTKLWDAQFLCQALQSYTASCQAARVQMTSWRNSTFCVANCPKHSHYVVCGTACPDSCWASGHASNCSLPCVETCQCDDGFVFEGEFCVPAASCGCLHRGAYHRRDQPFWADEACTESCVCERPGAAPRCAPSSCGARASCAPHAEGRVCLPYRLGSCALESRRHFRTFDGRAFDFQGSCAYRLAGLCPGGAGLTPFEVRVLNAGNDAESSLKVVVSVYNITVEICSHNNKRVTVDGLHRNMPYALSGGKVAVRTAGLRTLLHTDFGLSVALYANGRLAVMLSSEYAGATCGLCGNYNGDPADDLTGRGGQPAQSPTELVRSWNSGALPWCVEGCPGGCPACTPKQRAEYAGPAACGKLLNASGPFRICHAKVAPRRFHDDCVSDLCWQAGAGSALCRSLGNYVAACQEENVKIYDWRSPDFCEQPCPQGMVYDLCPIFHNNTCGGFPSSSAAFLPPGVCYENCVCPPGLMLSGALCVQPGNCGCVHQGEYLQLGEVLLSCKERCVCQAGGVVACHPVFCTEDKECGVQNSVRGCYPRTRFGRCSLAGRSHYRTFDGWDFHFPGTCNYTLSETCGPPDAGQGVMPFQVLLLNGASDQRQICVHAYGLKLTLSPKHPYQVRVNGVLERLPFSAGNLTVHRQGLYLAVQALNSVSVTFDLRSHVVVRLPESYRSRTCGLCGNYNGDPADDLWLPTAKGGPDCSDGCGDSCPLCVSLRPRYASDRHCGLLKARTGAFNACHPLVDPAGYYRNCMYDLCVSEGRVEQLCDGLQAYAMACQEAGVQVAPWRNGTKCMFQCPQFSHYTPCANACLTVCAEVGHVVDCPAGCAEGCQCDAGFYYDGNGCVRPEECGCFLGGHRYELGEVRLLQNCTLNCTCGPPAICNAHTCPDSHTCAVRDEVMVCQSSDPCEGKCGAHEKCSQGAGGPMCQPPALDLCWAWGDPHFRSFSGTDFDFDGTCTYVLAASGGGQGALTPFVVTENSERRHAPWASSVRTVGLSAYGYAVTLRRQDRGAVRVNGLLSPLPVSLRDKIRVDYWGDLVMLQTDFGLQVIYDWASLVLVALHPAYRGKVYGLCAFDGVAHAGSDGARSVIEWAKLQAVSDGDWLCCTDCGLTPPPLTPEAELHSREHCAVLEEPAGPFALCAERVSAQPFIRGCVQDLSRSDGDHEVLAQTLRSYTSICQYHGFSFQNPGDLYHDEEDVCGPHGEFNACVLPCRPSCDHFTSPVCAQPCMWGCVCDAGYVFVNQTCSPADDCGCLDSIGQQRRPNETFWSPESCEDRCTCDPSSRTVACVRVPCPHGQRCQVLSGVRGCYPANPVNCTLLGGLHFRTFNGHTFDFRGGHTYTLAAAPSHAPGLVPFDVSIGNAAGGARLFLSLDLTVQVYGQVLTVAKETPHRLQVNGLYTPLPYSFNKGQILAYHSPSSVAIQTDFGLQVAVYRTGAITVLVPGWYSSVLQGMCGKPGDPKGELVTRSGRARDPQEFADGWKTGAEGHPLPSDPKRCSAEEQDVFKDVHYCHVLLDKQGPFKECIAGLDPQLYFDSCLADTCAHDGHPTALCNAIGDYATACQAASLTVRQWRSDTFCGAACPVNSHYELCGPSCPYACSGSLSWAACSSPCQEGCQCDSALKIDADRLVLSDGACVPYAECGCQYKGQYYPSGTFVLGARCQEKCHCGAGHKMVCSSPGCGDLETCAVEAGVAKCVPAHPGTCQVLGGFGYITFDGYALAHHGICTYVLTQSKTSALPPFKVLVSVERVENALDDPLKAIVLILDEDKVELFPGILWKVRVNQEDFTLPMNINNSAIKAYQDGGSSVLETDFGLQIRFTSTLYVQVIVPPGYSGATSGLCGNYNGNAADDLNPDPHSKQPAGSPSAFLESCAEAAPGQQCALDCVANCGPCSGVSERKGHASDPCDLLTSTSGPFSRCCNAVPVQPYHDACVRTRCSTSRRQEALCLSLEAYAAACRAKGIQVDAWREPGCRLQCPDQSYASSLVDSCSSTCPEMITPGLCKRRSEGCQCNGSSVFNGDVCARVRQCGCVHRGRYIKNKEFFYAKGCTKRCWCEPLGGAACAQTSCSSGLQCLLKDGAWGCHGDVGVCQVRPDLSFRTLDGLESNLRPDEAFNLASCCDRQCDLWFQLVLFRGLCAGSRAVNALQLLLHGATVVVQNGVVYVDGDLVSLPFSLSSGVSVSRIWDWPEVRVVVRKGSGAQPDLELEASTSGSVWVRPSSVYSDKLCGACGNYNGLACDDLPHSKNWTMSLNGCGFGDSGL